MTRSRRPKAMLVTQMQSGRPFRPPLRKNRWRGYVDCRPGGSGGPLTQNGGSRWGHTVWGKSLFHDVGHKSIERVGNLGAGGDKGRVGAASVAEQALGGGPADVLDGPLGDHSVGVELDCLIDVIALVVG